MPAIPLTPAVNLNGQTKMGQPSEMTMGTSVVAVQGPPQVGPKVQALGVPQAGVQVPTGGLGQGLAKPPVAGQSAPTGGLIGNQMMMRTPQ
jgi:hypothetical protein